MVASCTIHILKQPDLMVRLFYFLVLGSKF